MTNQPVLSSRARATITVEGLDFRDLDSDGQLAPYEDWRLPAGERAAGLLTRMTPEEKAGLMIIGSHHPGYSSFLPEPVEEELLSQKDVSRDANPITGQQYPEPVLVTSSTENAINLRHQRFLISRDNLTPAEMV